MSKITHLVNFFRWISHRKAINILSTEETFHYLISKGVSVSRFGDGEFNLAKGQDMQFQESSQELSNRLNRVLNDQDNNRNCLVCVPYSFLKTNHLTIKSKRFWSIYFAQNFPIIFPLLSKDYNYGDSQISRIYINRKNKKQSIEYFNNWKRIFNDKKILIVEGENSKFGTGNSLLDSSKSIKRIICPSPQTFNYYKQIYDAILTNSSDVDLILLSLGPTATILSYELSKIMNAQIIDSGNIDLEYEWWLNSSKTKTAHPYKYSIETESNSEPIERFIDADYETQIILKIEDGM